MSGSTASSQADDMYQRGGTLVMHNVTIRRTYSSYNGAGLDTPALGTKMGNTAISANNKVAGPAA